MDIKILHHGATHGVTGSCHELFYTPDKSCLIDCGLFQGDDHSEYGQANADNLVIDFDISHVQALIVTHTHIDHIGRIPYLFAAGFDKPVYCSEATATLMPLILKDALKIGFTKDKQLIDRVLNKIKKHIKPLPYAQWLKFDPALNIKLKPAGHILGSAYIECDIKLDQNKHRVVFSGDLGAPYAPLLPNPKPPYACDTLVIESTYGDKNHHGRKKRRQTLKNIIERCVENRGVVLIPAFSIGRTQELLYEFEQLIHQYGKNESQWRDIEIIVDSPLAHRFTDVYRELKNLWDKEARKKVASGRHPLNFDQLLTIDDYETHKNTIKYLQKTGRPVIIISASGMCAGGRIVDYLKAFIENKLTDIVFTGYQAKGTTGRTIQHYGNPSQYPNAWVDIDDKRYLINAKVHTISGYSAHAGQGDLINFVKRMRYLPKHIRIIHGDDDAKYALSKALSLIAPDANIIIP